MPIKSFRGMMTDKSQDTILLHTNNGSTGYRIKKFEMMSNQPVNDSTEHIMMIWKVAQDAGAVAGGMNAPDFSDQTLLAAGVYTNNSSAHTVPSFTSIVFDNEVFNQDIYITHSDEQTAISCNYYIELEQIKLDLGEQTVATLKDIRNIVSE